MTVQENKATLNLTVRCHNRSDVSLASINDVEQALLMDIGKLHLIDTFHLKITLKRKEDDHSNKLPISRAWTFFITVIHLSQGQMAL